MNRPAIAFLLLALAMAFLSEAAAPTNPTYTFTVDPSVPVSCGGTVTLTLSIANGQNNQAYSVTLEVIKPNNTGRALTNRVINTNNAGLGSTVVPYPDPTFTPINGTVATDVAGVYTVIANQTSPTNIGTVTTAQFTVSCQLTVVITDPLPGALVERGRSVRISATVSDLSGAVGSAIVKANSPSGGEIVLTQTSPGAYSIDYDVLLYDQVGLWTIMVQAEDIRGNTGTSNPVTVSVVRSEIIVYYLAAYNDKGVPATDFVPGETIYPFFQLQYSNGDPISTGQFRVTVKNPSGTTIANLTATYQSSRFGFYSQSGFTASSIDPGGSWTIIIEAYSLNDGFGNTGPSISSSYRVQVVTTTLLNLFLYLTIGLIALLGGAVVFKRYHSSLIGFDHLDHLMGGQLPRASSVLLFGDPGSGKTVLSSQLLWEELESGKQCALLSYDAFPEDVQLRMKEFGWDITRYLRKGRLKIIDCYSGLAGEGGGAIRDPSDLTELNIQVTSFIAKAKVGTVTVILDSLTPIFSGVDAKQAINFIQTVSAKVKKAGGLFILTASSGGAVPADAVAKIKTIVDGIIELTLVRSGRQVSRYLSVLKMERRRILPESVPIEIDRKRGIVFRVSRLETAKDQLTKALPFYARESDTQPIVRSQNEYSTRPSSAVSSDKSGKPITPAPDTSQYAAGSLHRPGTQRRERDDSRGSRSSSQGE